MIKIAEVKRHISSQIMTWVTSGDLMSDLNNAVYYEDEVIKLGVWLQLVMKLLFLLFFLLLLLFFLFIFITWNS